MWLDEHMDSVEKYGFDRDEFPWVFNGHRVVLLKNQAHETHEGHLRVHLTLYCEHCAVERTVRGCNDEEWEPRHMQDVKLAALGEYTGESCVGSSI